MNLTLNLKHDSLKCGTQEKTIMIWTLEWDVSASVTLMATGYVPCMIQALAQLCWIGQPCWTYSCSSLDTSPSSALLDILLLTQALAYTGSCWTQTALAQPCWTQALAHATLLDTGPCPRNPARHRPLPNPAGHRPLPTQPCWTQAPAGHRPLLDTGP